LLLEARSIAKSFAGAHALRGVSFDLNEGEVHALVGENGAGKSTLIKILSGAESRDSGTLAVRGEPVSELTPSLAHALGIATIYQQPSLFPHLSVAENIAIARERGGLWRRVRWPDWRAKARDVLARLDVAIDPDRLVGTLTMPEQQVVEIAKALATDARIVIMDEPTASLSGREVGRLLAIVARLRAEGAGIVYISHRLDEIFTVADRITVLRDGEAVATRGAAQVDRGELIRLMVGRDLSVVYPRRSGQPGRVALEVANLSSAASGLHDVSLEVRSGEIVGIAGLVGSGRTELAETLFGLRHADAGTMHVDGAAVRIERPDEAMAHGIAYVPEDRRQHGVVLPMSVAANTTLASLGRIARNGIVDAGAERAAAERAVRELGVKTASVEAPVESLSGGNQQKVALARWLTIDPRILILDEPTQGVDVGAKAEIHAIINRLADRGAAVVMISSELEEVLALSDRVAVMRDGTIAGVLARADATADRVMELALHAGTRRRRAGARADLN
jgi:ABC-type sugar transport system ATPase subunit